MEGAYLVSAGSSSQSLSSPTGPLLALLYTEQIVPVEFRLMSILRSVLRGLCDYVTIPKRLKLGHHFNPFVSLFV